MPRQTHARIRFANHLIVLATALLMSLLLATPAFAQDETDPESPPPARDYVSCGHFESQAAAQEYFDGATLEDPTILDSDGDGVACEDAFPAPGSEPVYDYVSCGHFESQAAAQEYFDEGTLDDPSVLDWDGDGVACEEAFGTGSAPATEGATQTQAGTGSVAQSASAPAVAIKLPNTGSGAEPTGNIDGAVVGLALLSGMTLILSRMLPGLARSLARR